MAPKKDKMAGVKRVVQTGKAAMNLGALSLETLQAIAATHPSQAVRLQANEAIRNRSGVYHGMGGAFDSTSGNVTLKNKKKK